MSNILNFSLIILCNLFCVYSYAEEPILYKSANFLITENEFVEKFSNEKFICRMADSGVGRQCESKNSSYGKESVDNATAFFVEDKFIGISLNFSIDETSILPLLKYDLMINALIDKYGKNRKIEKSNKNQNYSEIQKWQDPFKNTVTTNLFKPKSFKINFSIFIYSDVGNKIFEKESKKHFDNLKNKKSSDM